MKILWLDDEINDMLPLIEIADGLEAAGHKLERFASPDAALSRLHEDEFAVVIIDLQLRPRDQDGIMVAKEIKTSGITTPLVALTSYQTRFAGRIPEAGFAAVLNKSDYLGRGTGGTKLAEKLESLAREAGTGAADSCNCLLRIGQMVRGALVLAAAIKPAVSRALGHAWRLMSFSVSVEGRFLLARAEPGPAVLLVSRRRVALALKFAT